MHGAYRDADNGNGGKERLKLNREPNMFPYWAVFKPIN